MGTTCDVDQALFREAFGSLTWIVLNNIHRRANPIISPVSSGWDTSIEAKWAESMQFEYHEITTLAAQHIKPCKFGPKGQPIYNLFEVMRWFDKERAR